jgi:hypothetical protein
MSIYKEIPCKSLFIVQLKIKLDRILTLINDREYRRGNKKWTIHRNMTKKNKAKTQRNMCLKPLYANKKEIPCKSLFIVQLKIKLDRILTLPYCAPASRITIFSGLSVPPFT